MHNNFLRKTGWPLSIALSLAPAIFWALEMPLQLRFSGWGTLLYSLGGLAGLVGMAAFSITMGLSARLKIFEKFFNGINHVYAVHHALGGIAFCLLLFHPILMAGNYLLFSVRDAALFLLPGSDWAKNSGIAGLGIMIFALAATFYATLKYQVWKLTHKLLGIAFIFGLFHTVFMGGNTGIHFFLKIYLLALGTAGISAYFYRAIFGKILVKKANYTVEKIDALPDRTWEISFKPSDKAMAFDAGQFAFLTILGNGFPAEAHPFTISAGQNQQLKFAIKSLGDYTKNIGKLKVGDRAQVEGPYGVFNFRRYGNQKQIWIGGGIGISPFVGMARSLSSADFAYKIDLYYSCNNSNCFAFKNELESLSKTNPNLRLFLWETEKNSLITAQKIKEKSGEISDRDIFICGPQEMMDSLKKQFLEQGTKKANLHTEDFKFY